MPNLAKRGDCYGRAWKRALGSNLRDARQLSGMTLRDVERWTGIHFQCVSLAELGRHEPMLSTVLALCACYGCSITDVLPSA